MLNDKPHTCYSRHAHAAIQHWICLLVQHLATRTCVGNEVTQLSQRCPIRVCRQVSLSGRTCAVKMLTRERPYPFGADARTSSKETGETLWLPTSCLQLLQHISRSRPNHLLFAADFDYLPDIVISGENAPLVSSKVCSALLPALSL